MRSNLFPNPRRTRPPQGGEVAPAPHIFGGQGHLKVARWSPQTSATRLRTAGVALAGTRPPRDGEVSGVTVEIGLFAK
ncbi:hypothetical protein V6N13_103813 [Hibiscus sabdariffa]|uniref:Uncharacterized protein n=2 Tax=Hibiscus sabdariffa TaxID=183260 RepID=A0ABR2NT60_9ROSI